MGMTTAGWVFLITAWAFIFGLVIWCFRKIFSTNGKYE